MWGFRTAPQALAFFIERVYNGVVVRFSTEVSFSASKNRGESKKRKGGGFIIIS